MQKDDAFEVHDIGTAVGKITCRQIIKGNGYLTL